MTIIGNPWRPYGLRADPYFAEVGGDRTVCAGGLGAAVPDGLLGYCPVFPGESGHPSEL